MRETWSERWAREDYKTALSHSLVLGRVIVTVASTCSCPIQRREVTAMGERRWDIRSQLRGPIFSLKNKALNTCF